MSTSSHRLIPLMLLGASMVGVVGMGLNQPASAKTIVTCGPKGAAQIVEIVPAGCRVLAANSPPKQAGNAVAGSRLGFTFNASNSSGSPAQQTIAESQKGETLVNRTALSQ